MTNAFGIADNILIVGFDKHGRDHDEMLEKVLWMCRQLILNLSKDKCIFRCSSIPFFGDTIPW